MDITSDDVLMILDEHYNNVKVLDTLNQELFQLWMADKETVSDWGICLSKHLQVLAASFPDHFPPDHVAELKWDHFYGGLPKRLKAMVPYLKASLHEKDLFWLPMGCQEKQKRKNPWSYPRIHRARQLITPLNQTLLVSSLCRSSRGISQYLKQLTCAPGALRRGKCQERGGRRLKSRTLTVSMGLRKSSWCATEHGPWRMHLSGGEVLLPLQQLWALHPWLPASAEPPERICS